MRYLFFVLKPEKMYEIIYALIQLCLYVSIRADILTQSQTVGPRIFKLCIRVPHITWSKAKKMYRTKQM